VLWTEYQYLCGRAAQLGAHLLCKQAEIQSKSLFWLRRAGLACITSRNAV
jgi:hypothetical protein